MTRSLLSSMIAAVCLTAVMAVPARSDWPKFSGIIRTKKKAPETGEKAASVQTAPVNDDVRESPAPATEKRQATGEKTGTARAAQGREKELASTVRPKEKPQATADKSGTARAVQVKNEDREPVLLATEIPLAVVAKSGAAQIVPVRGDACENGSCDSGECQECKCKKKHKCHRCHRSRSECVCNGNGGAYASSAGGYGFYGTGMGACYPQLNSALYPCPRPDVPVEVGHTLITNQAFYPHEMLWGHEYRALYPPYYYENKCCLSCLPFFPKPCLKGTLVTVKYKTHLGCGFHPPPGATKKCFSNTQFH